MRCKAFVFARRPGWTLLLTLAQTPSGHKQQLSRGINQKAAVPAFRISRPLSDHGNSDGDCSSGAENSPNYKEFLSFQN
jgi:hypothetical protein